MPRVAVYYYIVPETGMRNDGPPLFALFNLKRILDPESVDVIPRIKMREGRNVVHLFPDRSVNEFGKFDLHLLIDHGEDALNVPLDFEIPHPNAYWVSDAHLGYEYRLSRAKQFDHVFCCQKRCLEEFHKDGIPYGRLHWLPHAVEPLVYKPETIIEKWDWCFIGYLNSKERIDLFDRFTKELPNFYLGWRRPDVPGYNVLEDASHKFNQSKLIVNESIKDDINMRIFESLAARRCLLTEEIPTLDSLFENWRHLVTFKSIDDAVEKAKHLLSDNIEREKIAQAGYKEVMNKHTYHHRMLEILDKTIGYKPKKEQEHATVAVGASS